MGVTHIINIYLRFHAQKMPLISYSSILFESQLNKYQNQLCVNVFSIPDQNNTSQYLISKWHLNVLSQGQNQCSLGYNVPVMTMSQLLEYVLRRNAINIRELYGNIKQDVNNSVKCMLQDHRNNHQDSNILLLTDIQKNNETLSKLLQYLHQIPNNQNNIEEFQWLREGIINNHIYHYPQLTCENIFNHLQDKLLQNIEEMKHQFEQSVTSRSQKRTRDQIQELLKFKHTVEDYLERSQSAILQNFQQSLQTDSFEKKSTDYKSLQFPIEESQYNQQIQMSQDFSENIQQQSYKDFDSPVLQNSILPCCQFITKSSGKKKTWFNNQKNSVQFEQGGKIIKLENGTIVSKESFIGGIIEVRIRVLSFITQCVHIGIIEKNAYELNCNLENAGVWACIGGNCESKMQKTKNTDVQIPLESIISLFLNFDDDLVFIQLVRRDGIIELASRQGCLLNQGQHIFISNQGSLKLELIN